MNRATLFVIIFRIGVSAMMLGATMLFVGKRGAHLSHDRTECDGRFFMAKQVGSGGVHVNRVECQCCGRELDAFEKGLAQPEA